MKEITRCDECKYYRKSLWGKGKINPEAWCIAPRDLMRWLDIPMPINESLKAEVWERQCPYYEPKENI